MRSNTPIMHRAYTHESGTADPHQSPLTELRRAVSACLLFESTFYEKGGEIAERIATLCQTVGSEDVALLAREARTQMKLRHVPLFLCVQLARKRWAGLASVLADVIQRPDEMGEFLALYWKPNKQPLSAQVKKGLAAAFRKFSPYQLAKWNRDNAIKLRDVLFLCHAKPKDTEQDALWKQLIDGTLPIPDTWESALSSGKDRRETWERLLAENKLGYMALLMNLRNMASAGVRQELVESALRDGAANSKALPYRFIAAYKHAPQYAQSLSDSMEAAIHGELAGSTAVVLDVSGSMNEALSAKGETQRWEAAAGMAVLLRKICASCRIFVYAHECQEVANLHGLGLVSTIRNYVGGGTNTALALQHVKRSCPDVSRVILITDEQASDGVIHNWATYGYVVNIAPYKPGLEASRHGWTRISGWSERVVEWIAEHER